MCSITHRKFFHLSYLSLYLNLTKQHLYEPRKEASLSLQWAISTQEPGKDSGQPIQNHLKNNLTYDTKTSAINLADAALQKRIDLRLTLLGSKFLMFHEQALNQ